MVFSSLAASCCCCAENPPIPAVQIPGTTSGCSIVVAGNWYKVPYVSDFPYWVVTTAAAIGIFAFSILVANIAYLPIIVWSKLARSRARKQFRDSVRNEVELASNEERAILAYLISTGRKAFAAEFTDRRLVPLVSKGLIKKLGGANSLLEWPYVVQEDVWEYLQQNRDRYFDERFAKENDPFNWKHGW